MFINVLVIIEWTANMFGLFVNAFIIFSLLIYLPAHDVFQYACLGCKYNYDVVNSPE